MSPQLGTQVLTAEVPPATINPFSTANCFMVGLSDWGPSGSSGVNTASGSLAQAAAVIGAPTGSTAPGFGRSTTNATLYDAADTYYREGGSNIFFSRVLGTTPVKATLILQDAGAATAATLTALYYGVGGNSINVVVANNTTNYTVTLQDANANVLAVSPVLSNTNKADLISWAATTGLVTATAGNANLPKTIAATPLATGTDDRGTATVTSWTTAINAFGPGLGPGQIIAPGQTNTALAGIWSSLVTHASNNNRAAICDETDGASVATIQSDVSAAAIPSTLQSYGQVWAGNRLIPGVTPGTTRNVPPSPIIAALCARVDASGNPNLPPAGQNFALQYATQAATLVSGSTDTYSLADLGTLNASGVNGFQTRFGVPEAYGLASMTPTTTDAIYWQANHARLRMALVADIQVASEPFVFSQADGQGADITEYNTALQGVLMRYFAAGALYGQNPTDAFSVNTGPVVNPPAQLAAGTLAAQVAVRMSPGIQLVITTLNAIAITQTVPQAANPAQNQ